MGVWTVGNDVPPRFGCRVWMISSLYGSPTHIAPPSTSRLEISPTPASNLTYRPQICPPDLQLGLQASNQPSVAQICPPNLKSTLKASILPSSLQICLLWPESVIYCQKCASSGRMEIPPCVLQDIGPLGPLPCSHSTSSLDHSQQGIGYR